VKGKEESSFFEKKEANKLLSISGLQRRGSSVATRRNQGEKSFFASFFSKKEDSCLSATCLPSRRLAAA
jgi:hypothetical protein